MKYLLIVLCLLLSACKDSCTDNGGVWVISGIYYTPMYVGTAMQMMPNYIYECNPRGYSK